MTLDEIRHGMRVRRIGDEDLRDGVVREIKPKMFGVPSARIEWPGKTLTWHPVSLLEEDKKA